MIDESFDFPFYKWEKKLADKPFLRQPFGKLWETYTWGEVGLMARKLATGLKSLGLKDKSHIGLVSKNCREWIIADLAITIAGYISVPFFPTLKSYEIKNLLNFGDVDALFVGKLENWDEMKQGVPPNLPIISFPHYKNHSKIDVGEKWFDFINRFDPQTDDFYPKNNDIWTIIFTSGTTGDPKGAVIKYKSLYNTKSVHEDYNPLGIDEGGNNRFISYLPLNHIFERVCIEWTCLRYGGNLSFVESLESFGQNLSSVSPTAFQGVPRIYSKFQEKILLKIPQTKLTKLLKIPFLSWIIKRKLKKTLGMSKAKVIISGAAALPVELIDWFQTIGIYITNGYGMTENCCVCTNLNPYQNHGKGSVGKISSPDVSLKITGEGEICMKGPFLMDGYYKNKEMTDSTLQNDWLHTGDKGFIDDDGYLYVTGRVKDIFKTTKGKYIEPAAIESKFGNVDEFSQICLVGLNCVQPLLLVVPTDLAKSNRDQITIKISKILNEVNNDLDNYKKISKIIFVKEDWTPDNEMTTPTLKIKRAKIDEKFSLKYNHWEKSAESIVWE